MPIKIQKDLPARAVLESENIFVMDEARALSQDIRPLEILILNLMPIKEDTETQLLRALSNTPLQIDCTFLMLSTHVSKNTSASHLNKFYVTFQEIRKRRFDGMIITGAPVEMLEYEEVNYWPELTQIMEWTKTHVTSTMHICWGAQAGLYYHYGIPKYKREKKTVRNLSAPGAGPEGAAGAQLGRPGAGAPFPVYGGCAGKTWRRTESCRFWRSRRRPASC